MCWRVTQKVIIVFPCNTIVMLFFIIRCTPLVCPRFHFLSVVMFESLYVCVYRPLVHLFGHTRQSAEVIGKHGVLFSNGSQFAGHDVTRPNVVDVYVRPELPAKTKTYKLPAWKEAELNVNSTSSDAQQQASTSSKPSCSLQ